MTTLELSRDEVIVLRRFMRKDVLTSGDENLLAGAVKKLDSIDLDADPAKRKPGRPRKSVLASTAGLAARIEEERRALEPTNAGFSEF